ncbi:MAG: YfcE family phosphodiesterase [Clostridia bacterium]|nr:YfcE family phosphodiesterase [Clostridia bacterium]
MKTAIVISDTHGRRANLKLIESILPETDYLFFLGDGFNDVRELSLKYPQKVVAVLGNCDGGHGDKILEIEGVKIMLTHGHDYGVKSGLINLYYKACEIGAKVVFYGHTHQSNVTKEGGVTLINPGALSAYIPSYAYVIFDSGKVYEKIVESAF